MQTLSKNQDFDAEFYESLNPNKFNGFNDFKIGWNARSILTKKFGSWSYPTFAIAEELKAFIGNDKCLEIGAGAGILSMMLQQCGIDIIATDNAHEFKTTSPIFTDIIKMSALDAVTHFVDANVLVTSWARGFLSDAVKNFKGNKIIFIGEEFCGCTGSIEDGECGFNKITTIESYKSYPGICDQIILYMKKNVEK
ncbi:hypothetical protein BMW23_0781 [Bodo saltans virus]|uniref:Methyltransferase n=1 Tax=Bodo saltans virus TaxID=2024608 RepID=A0A2H4UVD7_9VIRU|nr:hypothetical protein QJ851_gp0764 [Bodo saltans virus]ATZ80827.1 hypothetical protein BMW23_0781 [Bodo saltans virus]